MNLKALQRAKHIMGRWDDEGPLFFIMPPFWVNDWEKVCWFKINYPDVKVYAEQRL